MHLVHSILFVGRGIIIIICSYKLVNCFIQESVERKLRRPPPLSRIIISQNQSPSYNDEDHNYPQLPSTFDLNLPPSLRGEAVRSAIRTHTSGICFDFSSLEMQECNIGGVIVSGKGTSRFLEGKLTKSFTNSGLLDKPVKSSLKTYASDYEVKRGHLNEACLLSSKGQIVDVITVLSVANNAPGTIDEALLLTSPGHSGSALFDRLDPYIFPFDGVKLTDLKVLHPMYDDHHDLRESHRTRVFTVAASKDIVALSTVERMLTPLFMKESGIRTGYTLPMPAENSDEFIQLSFTRGSSSNTSNRLQHVQVNIFPRTFLPPCVCKGYTFVITESMCNDQNEDSFVDLVWHTLTKPVNGDGPILLGPLEWDTLRIESGWPGFGTEMTGEWSGTAEPDMDNATSFDEDNSFPNEDDGHKPMPLASSLQTYYSLLSKRGSIGIRASPLELKLEKLIDTNKGCYQGQEEIAALLKNKRGPPRSLYSICFPDDDNFFDESSDDYVEYDDGHLENQTKPPKVGDALYVLGSNEQIYVGKITSVAERSGTSRPETVAMALVRRFDSIMSAMKDMDLDTSFDENLSELDRNDAYGVPDLDGSGILYPPPLDPLGGLEVCIKGTFTRGILKVVNWRRIPNWQNLYEKEFSSALINNQSGVSSVMGYIPQKMDNHSRNTGNLEKKSDDYTVTDNEMERAIREAEAAAKVAEAAVAEAKRKAERIESLKAQAAQQSVEKDHDNASISQSDSIRKSEKLDMLKRQAEAALERRRQRQEKK